MKLAWGEGGGGGGGGEGVGVELAAVEGRPRWPGGEKEPDIRGDPLSVRAFRRLRVSEAGEG